MSSSMQLLNSEAEQDLDQVGEGFFWMMLAVLEMSLTSLSAEVLELVFTTVDTLKMQVLCVQVHVQYFFFTRLLTWKYTIYTQHNNNGCPPLLSFLRLCHSSQDNHAWF